MRAGLYCRGSFVDDKSLTRCACLRLLLVIWMLQNRKDPTHAAFSLKAHCWGRNVAPENEQATNLSLSISETEIDCERLVAYFAESDAVYSYDQKIVRIPVHDVPIWVISVQYTAINRHEFCVMQNWEILCRTPLIVNRNIWSAAWAEKCCNVSPAPSLTIFCLYSFCDAVTVYCHVQHSAWYYSTWSRILELSYSFSAASKSPVAHEGPLWSCLRFSGGTANTNNRI